MLSAHLFWLTLVCLLGGWWGWLVLRQAAKIADLQSRLGLSADTTQTQWHRTQRMLYWEMGSFYGLLLASAGVLFWIYWRDVKRSKSTQAFFAAVTHELRTPLTSIRLQAEVIAEVVELKNIQRLLEDTGRLEAQVERALELARIEGGGPVSTQPIELQNWIAQLIQTWGNDLKEKIEFSNSLDEVWVQADPVATQILFKNLFENAVRHSQREKVRVAIQRVEEDHLKQKYDKNMVFIEVKDDGVGFHENRKELGKIFKKGSRSQGTGVGLYLVKVLMDKMGGVVHLAASPSGFNVILGFQKGNHS
jgi:signal transduction histidine kinase